jgi:hypothetical protein
MVARARTETTHRTPKEDQNPSSLPLKQQRFSQKKIRRLADTSFFVLHQQTQAL